MECHPFCALIAKISLHALNNKFFPFLLPAVRMYAHVAGLVALSLFFLIVSFLLFFLFSFVIVYDFWFFFLIVSVLLVWVFWVWALWIWIFYDSVFLACVNKLWEIWYFFDLFLYYFATGFFITMQTTIGVSTSPLICFAHAYCMQSALQDLP